MKKPLHSFGQRVPKCTPNFRLSPKNFLRKFIPSPIPTGNSQMHTLNRKKFLSLHLFGITSLNDTLFHRKNEKIFFIRLRALYFACPEKAFSLIPTENSKMHTLNRNKFLPLHLFGIGVSKRNLFFRKKAKNLPANIGRHSQA